jgi:hypothetical protein
MLVGGELIDYHSSKLQQTSQKDLLICHRFLFEQIEIIGSMAIFLTFRITM